MTDIDRIDPEKPILIAGATASGKSELALKIAETQGGVIINADALQVYECWSVLSARPNSVDLARAPHALYGHVGYQTPYSVGDWLRAVVPFVQEGPRAIFVGGTGLYFSALIDGLTEIPAIPPEIRARGNRLRTYALEDMRRHLQAEDFETASSIDMNNPMRVQRAWEVLTATGRGLRNWHAKTPPAVLPVDQCQPFVVERPVEILGDRIEHRFKWMVENGALDEVKALLPCWDPLRPASRAIGARELMAHLNDEFTLAEATRLSVIATQQFAKRQRTWFRNRFKSWPRVLF